MQGTELHARVILEACGCALRLSPREHPHEVVVSRLDGMPVDNSWRPSIHCREPGTSPVSGYWRQRVRLRAYQRSDWRFAITNVQDASGVWRTRIIKTDPMERNFPERQCGGSGPAIRSYQGDGSRFRRQHYCGGRHSRRFSNYRRRGATCIARLLHGQLRIHG
jgi:hypothetical protein